MTYYSINSRKFIKDIKNNYPKNDENKVLYYITDDLFDHVEDFYWQQKIKRPFCQLIVKVEECTRVQETHADYNEIIIIGKNPLNIFNKNNSEGGKTINANRLIEIAKEVETKLNLKDQGFEYKEYYRGNYFFHFEYFKRQNLFEHQF